MGLKFTKEYKEIIAELLDGIYLIEDFYNFFDMDNSDWNEMSETEKKELAKTLSDDIFYALESDPTVFIGKGSVKYNKMNSEILIFNEDNLVKTVSLVM